MREKKKRDNSKKRGRGNEIQWEEMEMYKCFKQIVDNTKKGERERGKEVKR